MSAPDQTAPAHAEKRRLAAAVTAIRIGRPGWLQSLLTRGLDPDADAPPAEGCRLLHLAAWSPCSRCAQVLIDAGAAVDARSTTGQSPLHLAATRGAEGVLRALLAAGADPGTRNAHGRTPLDVLHLNHTQARLAECEALLAGALRDRVLQRRLRPAAPDAPETPQL